MRVSCKWSSVAGSFSGTMLLPPFFVACNGGKVYGFGFCSCVARLRGSLFKAIMRVLSTPTGTRPTQMHAPPRHAVREYSKYCLGNLPAVPRMLRRQTSIGANAGCTYYSFHASDIEHGEIHLGLVGSPKAATAATPLHLRFTLGCILTLVTFSWVLRQAAFSHVFPRFDV